MTAIAAPGARGETALSRSLLLAAILLASLTEAIASTLLALGRADIIGDIYATPDEFAWLDVGYTAFKLIGFALAPWFLTRIEARRTLLGATLAMGLASALGALVVQLDLLIFLRIVQGLAGAILLVSGQALLFWSFSAARQPVVQALFAMGAVVAPATLAPVLQGWLIDTHDWTWILFGIFPVALAAAGLLLLGDAPSPPAVPRRGLDIAGLAGLAIALVAASFLLSQGSRWDWLDASRINWSIGLVVAGGALFALRQRRAVQPLFDLAVFRVEDFAFAFIVSFVAGAALFGSAFLIPAFSLLVLRFTATEAGALLLPSGAVFAATLLLAAALMQARWISPIVTVPFGILTVMTAMWMLSGSSGESGPDDMMPAILLRGFGLGCLFLSITLIAFSKLPPVALAFGIGIFNIGRQLGGLIGVAGLQTLIDHQTTANQAVLGAAITSGSTATGERLSAIAAMLVGRGMDAAQAAKAAGAMLGRSVAGQSAVIAFDTAFNAVALLFIVAAPIIVAVKKGLARSAARRSAAKLHKDRIL
ncbi:MFS transporter [Sphingopyxis sp. PAMC25046]|uniref:MFS transporter n=1 Tax=Sphingopyxis sp. PAMC25046 TaxID=2565556 RepID=UPI00109E1D6F|nr:MFS transporter [Sphingopyxis sp. PAMC25046]QCB54535.1 MFS transporter [Sphingopyxis sp. PAMC25046]